MNRSDFMKLYGIKTCGTVKKAVKWFNENGIEFDMIDLREVPPSKEEIKQFHTLSGLPIKTFFNTSGKLYREMKLKDTYQDMSLNEIYQLLSDNPMLIKRPLIVDGDYVRTGFKVEAYQKQWQRQ